MALQVPKVLHDRLALYVLKHVLGMVWEVGLVAIHRVPGKLLHISVVEVCLNVKS